MYNSKKKISNFELNCDCPRVGEVVIVAFFGYLATIIPYSLQTVK